MTPNILYYARLEHCKNGKKTAKYEVIAQAGYYPPMEKLKGRDGKIYFYLLEKLKEGTHVPSVRLQAKNSFNFTGLKEYFVNGSLSGFAYGYPPSGKTYSSKELENPFYEYRKDGFLFTVHQEGDEGTPDTIELIVLEGAKVLISSYCKQLAMGGFNEQLSDLRKQCNSTRV